MTVISLQRRVLLGVALAACLAAAPGFAQAPNQKILKIIAPIPPGSAMDQTARLIARELGARLGMAAIVENRPGAGGTIGTRAVATAAPDGATLLLAGQGMISIAPHMMPNLGFDPIKTLVPVSPVSIIPGLLVVPGTSPYNSIKELVAAGKAKDAKLNFGSGGIGTGSHLMGEMFNARMGTNFQHVAYQGSNPMVLALVADQVQMEFAGAVDTVALVKAGKLKALASTSPTRHWLLPDVQTLAEQGLGDDWLPYWVALFAPAGTPPATLDALRAAMTAVLKQPETAKALQDFGMVQDTRTLEQFRPVISSDSVAAEKLITRLNLKP